MRKYFSAWIIVLLYPIVHSMADKTWTVDISEDIKILTFTFSKFVDCSELHLKWLFPICHFPNAFFFSVSFGTNHALKTEIRLLIENQFWTSSVNGLINANWQLSAHNETNLLLRRKKLISVSRGKLTFRGKCKPAVFAQEYPTHCGRLYSKCFSKHIRKLDGRLKAPRVCCCRLKLTINCPLSLNLCKDWWPLKMVVNLLISKDARASPADHLQSGRVAKHSPLSILLFHRYPRRTRSSGQAHHPVSQQEIRVLLHKDNPRGFTMGRIRWGIKGLCVHSKDLPQPNRKVQSQPKSTCLVHRHPYREVRMDSR